MTKPRLAILGTGNIAKFHATAFTDAGFDITHCAARENSTRAVEFAETFGIPHVLSNPMDVIGAADDWDALLLATWPGETHTYLEPLIETGKVCLVEKPVSTDPAFLEALTQTDTTRIRVAYNRRFYATIDYAKAFVDASPPLIGKVELPEMVKPDGDDRFNSVLLNSAHGIDLIFYLFGDVTLSDCVVLPSGGGRLCTLTSYRGDVISLVMNWNSPANFCITLEADTKRVEVKPFEVAALFEGMDILEPTEDLPLRRYVPKKVDEVSSFPTSQDLNKPGFVGQAQEIARMLEGHAPSKSANLMDAYRVQKLLHAILF